MNIYGIIFIISTSILCILLLFVAYQKNCFGKLNIDKDGIHYFKVEYQYVQSHSKLIFHKDDCNKLEIMESFDLKDELCQYYKIKFYESGKFRFCINKKSITTKHVMSGGLYNINGGRYTANSFGGVSNTTDNTTLYEIDVKIYNNKLQKYLSLENNTNTNNKNFENQSNTNNTNQSTIKYEYKIYEDKIKDIINKKFDEFVRDNNIIELISNAKDISKDLKDIKNVQNKQITLKDDIEKEIIKKLKEENFENINNKENNIYNNNSSINNENDDNSNSNTINKTVNSKKSLKLVKNNINNNNNNDSSKNHIEKNIDSVKLNRNIKLNSVQIDNSEYDESDENYMNDILSWIK